MFLQNTASDSLSFSYSMHGPASPNTLHLAEYRFQTHSVFFCSLNQKNETTIATKDAALITAPLTRLIFR